MLVGAGDIAVCGARSTEATAALLDRIDGTVMAVGDLAYFQGTAQQFRECYAPTWGRHFSRTRPVPGNHEYESPNAQPYFDYFGDLAGTPGEGYYSYDLGAWHIVALNSNFEGLRGRVAVDETSAQMQWLKQDLAQSRARCALAYFHHPLFSSGPNGNTTQMRPIWRALYDAGVDVVVSGHDHAYERYVPQDPNGLRDGARGIRQFVVGTGGAALTDPVRIQPNSEIRRAVWGVLKLTLEPESYTWEFVPIEGESFRDSGRDACH